MSIGIRTIYKTAANQTVTAPDQVTGFPSSFSVKTGQKCHIRITAMVDADGTNGANCSIIPAIGTANQKSSQMMLGDTTAVLMNSESDLLNEIVGAPAANSVFQFDGCFTAVTDCSVPVLIGTGNGSAGTLTIHAGAVCEITVF